MAMTRVLTVSVRQWAAMGACALSLWTVGCATPEPGGPRCGEFSGMTPAEAETRAERVRRDPRAYLQDVAAKCRTLEQYTLKFTRYERRGLFQTLRGPENVMAWFRREPFSLRLKWLNEDLKYDESAYSDAIADGEVRFVTRYWIPGLKPPPGVNHVDLQTPVIWGETKRPMTDFGLERLLDRTLKSLEESGDNAIIEYKGVGSTLTSDRPMHIIQLTYSDRKYDPSVQILYVDVDSDLPGGTELRARSGSLDSAYYYAEINADVELTDDDFLLTAERAAK